ncbi:MAG: PASTA domain-containing protein [Desulfobacterales bacterium]|nr:PASTA domain-containing protein [Desulfobacterales bacterium]
MISKLIKIFIIAAIFIGGAGLSTYLTLTWIVKSEETVVVPALKEKGVVYALQMLSDLGLNTRIKASRYSATVPADHVIAQEPAPGAEIKKGRSVKLVISRGQLSVLTPQLTGLPLSQAMIILEENGICPGTRAHSPHGDLPVQAIVSQSPPPGVTINRNNCVDLLISSGPHPDAFAMADLTTLSVEDAILKIEAGKLKLGDIATSATREVPLNTVARQTPPAGYRVVSGQVVHLDVNRARSASGQAAESASKKSWFFHHRTATGILNSHIRVRINSKYISYDLYNDFMPPAEDLLFLIPRFENITVMLYEDEELKKTVFPGSRLDVSKWSR